MNALYANVAYDPGIWFAIPIYWVPDGWESPQLWAAETARYLWDGLKPGRNGFRRTEAVLLLLAEKYGFRDPDVPETITYVHLPHPDAMPLLVKVWIDEADGMTLADAAVSDDPSCVEPPVVDGFTTEHLGSGIRVLRYVVDDLSHDGSGEISLYAVVHYAFLIPQEDAVMVARCVDPDLARLMQAMDDIDDFVREIRWAYEPQALVGGRNGK